MAPVVFSVSKLYKSYTTPVLRGIDFNVRAGEVHALLGANGAGKSTLAKIACGIVAADDGEMYLDGGHYSPSSLSAARQAGVNMVMQELSIIDDLSVAENLYIDELPSNKGVIDRAALRRSSLELLKTLGMEDVEPGRFAGRLGIGQKQVVEIGKAIKRPGRVLIFDEPTAALSEAEIERLFERIDVLRAAGLGIIYVSHRISEIRRISDRITVLRDGVVAGTWHTKQLNDREIVARMAGDEIAEHARKEFGHGAETVLTARGLHTASGVKGIDLDICRGEILGIAGLVGSGRSELLRALFGADKCTAGTIEISGTEVDLHRYSPRHAMDLGMAMVPEDRKGQSLLPGHSVADNLGLAALTRFQRRWGWLDRTRERAASEKQILQLGIQCSDGTQEIDLLSGGNQQKAVVGRWLLRDADIYLFDEPTRGIDIQSKYAIYDLLGNLADRGKAVVVVSSENLELMTLCDRISVMSDGSFARTFRRGEWSADNIMAAAFSAYSDVA